MKKYSLFICCMFLLSACGYTTTRHTANYADALSTHSIALLPASSEVTMINLSGPNERQYEYENTIEPMLQEALYEALSEKGYNVQMVSKQKLGMTPVWPKILETRDAFKEARAELYKEPSSSKPENAYNISGAIKPPYPNGSNVIPPRLWLIANYTEKVKNSGQLAAEFATSVALALVGVNHSSGPSEVAALHIGIIDARTGQIVWTDGGGDASNMFDNISDEPELAQKRVKKVVEGALKGLPAKDKLYETEEE